MAENITIARPYAEAAFDVADATGKLGDWASRLEMLAQVVANPDMHEAISNPNLSAEKLYGLIASVCGDALSNETQNLVRVLIDNRRLTVLPEISSLFDDLKRAREGQLEAHVTSAFPMSDAQVATLVQDLETRFKRRVLPVLSVDSELIGGVLVKVGDEVIDGTVRGKLAAMATALKS